MTKKEWEKVRENRRVGEGKRERERREERERERRERERRECVREGDSP